MSKTIHRQSGPIGASKSFTAQEDIAMKTSETTDRQSGPVYANTAQEEIAPSGERRFKTTIEKIALFLAVFFFIATVAFIALFVVYYIKYGDKESLENSVSDLENSISSLNGSISSLESSISNSESSTCNSPDCVVSASMMIKKMNPKADPCQDFYEYACGQFIDNTVVGEGRQEVTTLSAMQGQINEILKSIIEAEAKPDDPQYLKNMKNLYKSCMDEDQIEAVGLAAYLNDTEGAKAWPTLNSAWDPASFNLTDLIAQYARVYIQPLYTIGIVADYKDPTKNVVNIRDGSLFFLEEYFSRPRPRNDSMLLAVEKYLTMFAVALGANKTVAEEDSRDIVDLVKALTEIKVPKGDKRDPNKTYNPTTLIQLDAKYPKLGIARAMRALFSTANISLPDDELVINYYPTYLGNLSAALSTFKNRVIQNLFGSTYAIVTATALTRKMRELNLVFEKVSRGNSENSEKSPLWKTCLDQVSKAFPKGMSKQYIKRAFSEDTKTYTNQMVDNVKSEFRAMLKESSWLSDPTRNEACDKLTKMERKIGYPDHNFSDQDIESKYLKYTMNLDHYYNNKELDRRLNVLEVLSGLRKPVDKYEWKIHPFVANAYYYPSLNEIVITAGILQPPVFSQTFQDAMNYGGIGVVIGHEITHGFDVQGSQFDGDGVLRNWWQKEDRERFLARTKCLVDQFSNFHVDRVNMSLLGINVEDESVADLGGVKESFRAYKQLVKEKGEQPTLPGLGLTPDQVFFLAFGQTWCEKMTPQAWVDKILTDVHPPGKYRIIGTLQNTKEFAQAFKCPTGSYMNPRTKCTVW